MKCGASEFERNNRTSTCRRNDVGGAFGEAWVDEIGRLLTQAPRLDSWSWARRCMLLVPLFETTLYVFPGL